MLSQVIEEEKVENKANNNQFQLNHKYQRKNLMLHEKQERRGIKKKDEDEDSLKESEMLNERPGEEEVKDNDFISNVIANYSMNRKGSNAKSEIKELDINEEIQNINQHSSNKSNAFQLVKTQ